MCMSWWKRVRKRTDRCCPKIVDSPISVFSLPVSSCDMTMGIRIWIGIVVICSFTQTTHYVGAEVFHPPIQNVALKKPLTLQPADSTCGLDDEQEFCKSTEERISVESCWKDVCSSDCPSHTRLKAHVELFAKSTLVGDCLQTSNIVSPNGTASYSISFNGTGNATCYVDVDFRPLISIRLQQDAWSITFSVWIYSQLGTSTG